MSDLVLVVPGSIPITTSGKIRRAECVKLCRHGLSSRLDAKPLQVKAIFSGHAACTPVSGLFGGHAAPPPSTLSQPPGGARSLYGRLHA